MKRLVRIISYTVTQVLLPIAGIVIGVIIAERLWLVTPGFIITTAIIGAYFLGYKLGCKAPRLVVHSDDCGRAQYMKLSRLERYKLGDAAPEQVECTCQ